MKANVKHLSRWRRIRVMNNNKKSVYYDLDEHGRLKKRMQRQGTRDLYEEMQKLSIDSKDKSYSTNNLDLDDPNTMEPENVQDSNNPYDQTAPTKNSDSKHKIDSQNSNQTDPKFFLNDFIINETSYDLDPSDEFDLDNSNINFDCLDFSNFLI